MWQKLQEVTAAATRNSGKCGTIRRAHRRSRAGIRVSRRDGWLRYLEECNEATIDEATMVAGASRASPETAAGTRR